MSPTPHSIADLDAWRTHYGNQPSATPNLVAETAIAAQALPEPDERLVDLPFYLLGATDDVDDLIGKPLTNGRVIPTSNRIARDEILASQPQTTHAWSRLWLTSKHDRKLALDDLALFPARLSPKRQYAGAKYIERCQQCSNQSNHPQSNYTFIEPGL